MKRTRRMGPLPLIAMGFLLGLALPWRPDPWVGGVCACACALAAVGCAHARRGAGVSAILLLVAATCAGGARREALRMPTWTRVPMADAALVRGRVVSGCAGDGAYERCRMAADGWGLLDVKLPRGRCAAVPGDVIEVVATVRAVVPLRNAPRDPPELARVLHGLRWTAEAAVCERVGRDASVLDGLRSGAVTTRRWMERSLARALAPTDAGRARALLFGDRSGLDDREHEAFSETGMAHLLAVSGAHVSLLLALVGALLRAALVRVTWLTTRGVVPRVVAVAPLPMVGFFVMVTGEAPSSMRALLTATVTATASLCGRRTSGEATLALVALAMGACDPALVVDVGWVLSVVASWALARAPEESGDEDEARGLTAGVREEFTAALRASLRVGFAVMPALAWHFGRAPLTATVMNAVAAPVGEALLLPSVLVAVALGSALPTSVAVVACKPVGAVMGALFALPGVALRLPFASVATPMPTPAEWVIASAVALLACGRSAKGACVVLALGAVALGATECTHRVGLHPRGVVRVTTLDVGQGDAVVVELPDGEAMLIDGGGAITGGADPGARAVVPWLALRRRWKLAAVVLSHPHPDHAGGLPAVLRAVEVGQLWDTGQGTSLNYTGAYAETLRAARERGVRVRGPSELCGAPLWFHGAWVEVLAPCPSALDETPPNDASFVIRITHGRARALLPGDLERAGEEALLARVGRVDVLKVGHHGSRTSSSDAWLDALRPRVALVSAGHPSPFGHPHPSVVERFRARGVTLRRTDLDGAVSATLYEDGRLE